MSLHEDIVHAHQQWRKEENKNSAQYHWDFLTKEAVRDRYVFEKGYLAGLKAKKSHQNNPTEEKS